MMNNEFNRLCPVIGGLCRPTQCTMAEAIKAEEATCFTCALVGFLKKQTADDPARGIIAVALSEETEA